MAPSDLRTWWATPPRSGLSRIISPWEYRHLRGMARVRFLSGSILVVLGLLTLAFGGTDAKTYGWAAVFLAPAAANLGFGCWERKLAAR